MANKFGKLGLVTGLNDGSSWANAWQSWQTIFDNAVAGDDVFIQGSETLSVTVDDDTNTGTTTAPIRYIGVNTDESVDPWDDVDGTFATMDGNSTAANCLLRASGLGYKHFYNIEMTNPTGAVLNYSGPALYCVFVGCRFTNGTFGLDANRGTDYSAFIQCNFSGNSSIVLWDAELTLFLMNEVIGGNDGFDSGPVGENVLLFNIFHDNVDGIQCDSATNWILFNTIDGAAFNGINMATSWNHAYFNRITNNALYGITTGANPFFTGFNAFYNNTSGETNGTGEQNLMDGRTDISMAGDGYVDRDNDNFALTDSAEFRRRALNVGSYSV